MHTGLLPSAALLEFYRFALFLTGKAESAQRLMADVLASGETRMGEIRDPAHRAAWFANRLRQRCLEEEGSAGAGSPAGRLGSLAEFPRELLGCKGEKLAELFQGMPEPERSALALFYLELFSVEQIAQVLELELEKLAEVLERARVLLQNRFVEPLAHEGQDS